MKIDIEPEQLAPEPKQKPIVKICPRIFFFNFVFFSLDKILLKSCNFLEKLRKPTFSTESRVLKRKNYRMDKNRIFSFEDKTFILKIPFLSQKTDFLYFSRYVTGFISFPMIYRKFYGVSIPGFFFFFWNFFSMDGFSTKFADFGGKNQILWIKAFK